MTDRLIAALLYLYPPRWRHEYGDELQEVLQQRPLTLGSVADVAWQGVRQRWHEGGPVLAIGLFMVPWVAGMIVENLFYPGSRAAICNDGVLRVLHDSRITFPSVIAAPGGAEFFCFVLVSCGLITRLRERAPLWRSGVAATQLAAVVGLPVMILGLALITGIVDLRVISPAAAKPAVVAGHGWTYTFCTAEARVPATLAVFAAPLLRLPQAFVYGLVGGWVASRVRPDLTTAHR
jgi:hypothetical protein